jgi:capsular polysaccharide biosynthesis protein
LGRLLPQQPELGVLEIQNARLYGQGGWVISPEGFLLPDLTWYGSNVDEMRLPRKLPLGEQLRGVVLSLASDFSGKNYGHFLLDSLSRFAIFSKAKLSLSDVDYVYCPKPISLKAHRFIEALAIPSGKCIWADPGSCLHAETILAPSFPGTRRQYQPWLPAFWRERLGLPSGKPWRRLYITRGSSTRRITNEAALLPILSDFGIEVYNPSEDPDPPQTFSEAELVVGAHGAGLTDIIFCQPEARILEIIPSDHVHPYFYTLSQAAGLRYGYLVGQSAGKRAPGAWGPSPFDLCVDEGEFRSALDRFTDSDCSALRGGTTS